ncbi:MAG: hypothetical protein IJ408_07210 [Clostridia bacterium]|nr:hypothetical protein [Clostridia bacterium]
MKKTVSILLVLCLLISCAGCASNERTGKKLLTSACFSDAHNSMAMLQPDNSTGDYVLRKTHTNAIDHILDTRGQVDVALVGGDLMSDYPHWNSSGWLPYEYYVEVKKRIVDEYRRVAKGEKVMYNAGNHDYAQGELSEDGPGLAGAYNSSDFYFDGPMNKTLGKLSKKDMHKITSEYTEMEYLLGYHYEIKGVHFIGIAPDPDSLKVYSKQGYAIHPDTLTWLSETLERIDPDGKEIIFINCHYHMAYRSNDKIVPRGPASNDMLPILHGHRNVFWLFGHVHTGVREIAQSHTSEMLVHYDSAGTPLYTPATADSYTITEYSGPTTVYMGAGRISYSKKYFGDDIVSGDVGSDFLNNHPSTATPTVCQVMYFTVYDDRVEFQSINAGTHEGYTTDDIIKPYTVYLY